MDYSTYFIFENILDRIITALDCILYWTMFCDFTKPNSVVTKICLPILMFGGSEIWLCVKGIIL